MIAMGKNRVFLVVMLALCLFYTFSDMYVTGVMLMPMLFSTVCGNMVRNDLERSDTAYTVHVTIQREGIRRGEVSRLDCPPACVLAVVLQMVSAVVHRQSITQSGMIAACAVLLTVLTVSVELPVTIIFRDRVQIARVCILAVVFARSSRLPCRSTWALMDCSRLSPRLLHGRYTASAPCWARLRLPSPSWCRYVRVAHSPTVSAGPEGHRRSGGRIIHRRGRPTI